MISQDRARTTEDASWTGTAVKGKSVAKASVWSPQAPVAPVISNVRKERSAHKDLVVQTPKGPVAATTTVAVTRSATTENVTILWAVKATVIAVMALNAILDPALRLQAAPKTRNALQNKDVNRVLVYREQPVPLI